MANVTLFSGRLAADPELNTYGKGKTATSVTKLTLIRNEYAGKDKGERKVALQFSAFGKQAEIIAEHAAKGDALEITARIENNNYDKDGETHYGFNFIVTDFEFGAKKKQD
ncbi:MAG: single-stranded DNA-binding protein [Abyssibacter sp.]|nr:single-stranded DNA-binding protein [Abyssibacter sp.]MCK5859728.1 single-stranded DNA-binding protein [Abyssibacter sp.]